MHEVKILETTIRDGSYEVGFQFTLEDVAKLGGLLDAAGFSYIEIAHGSGLGGAAFGEPAAYSDEDYLRTGRAAVKNAKLGALMGFNKRAESEIYDRIRFCAELGIDFLRMGFVPSNTSNPTIIKAIELAVKLGVTVSVNFMRTYCTTPVELAQKAAALADLGVSWAYLVDSAGGMLPDQVRAFVAALKDRNPGLVVGFHGHNNTQMAVANSLAAIDAGASMIDVSLQGLGRATGNAPTEIMTTLLQERFEQELQLDRNLIYNLGKRVVRPWIKGGFDPSDVLSGVYNVHSSCLPSVTKAAAAEGLGIDDVLREAARLVDKPAQLEGRDLPADLLERGCAKLKARGVLPTLDLPPIARHAAALATVAEDLESLLAKLKVSALRDHRRAMLAVVDARLWSWSSAQVAVRGDCAVGTLPVSDLARLPALVREDWLDAALIDRRLGGAPDGFTPVDLVDLTVQSLLASASMSAARALISVYDTELRRALEGQLWRSERVSELERAEAVFVQGGAGVRTLEQIQSSPWSRAGLTVCIIGPIPSLAMLDALRASGIAVRLPDPHPLLAALLQLRTEPSLDGGHQIADGGESIARLAMAIATGEDALDRASVQASVERALKRLTELE